MTLPAAEMNEDVTRGTGGETTRAGSGLSCPSPINVSFLKIMFYYTNTDDNPAFAGTTT